MSNTALDSSRFSFPCGSILVVDDNISGAQTMQMLLQLEGYEVLVATSGSEALRLFESHSPRVVLLDIGLPDTDGYTVARTIRELDAGGGTLIIALTGWGNTHDVERALKAGCNCHFTKPVNFEHLATALREGIDVPSSNR